LLSNSRLHLLLLLWHRKGGGGGGGEGKENKRSRFLVLVSRIAVYQIQHLLQKKEEGEKGGKDKEKPQRGNNDLVISLL